MTTLKQLRAAYEELLEASKHLQEVSELYNRDTAPQPKLQQQQAPARPVEPLQPAPPPAERRPSSANARKLAPKAAVISETDDSAAEGGVGGNFTFMTSEMSSK